MLITQALQRIKTLKDRIAKKNEFVTQYAMRGSQMKDPLEGKEEDGSKGAVKRAIQAMTDMAQEIVKVRNAIARKNLETSVTVAGETKTIAEWLIWRRESAPLLKAAWDNLANGIHRGRMSIPRIQQQGDLSTEEQLLIMVDESDLVKRREKLSEVLSELDGELSLKNATTEVDIE